MGTFQLISMIISIALNIAQQKLSGKPQGDVSIVNGTWQLVQAALAIHAQESGQPLDMNTLQPYTPVPEQPKP